MTMKTKCAELLPVEYSEIAEIKNLKKIDQDRHQEQDNFLKTKAKTLGRKTKNKTKTLKMHLESVSTPRHASRLPIPVS